MSEKIDLAEWKRLAEAVVDYDAVAWGRGEWSSRNATIEVELLVAYSSPARVLALIEALEVARVAMHSTLGLNARGEEHDILRIAQARLAELLGEA